MCLLVLRRKMKILMVEDMHCKLVRYIETLALSKKKFNNTIYEGLIVEQQTIVYVHVLH